MMNVFYLITCLFCLAVSDVQGASLPINERPMFGGINKTDEMKKSDEAFLLSIEKAGYTRENGAKEVVKAGFQYSKKGDLTSAIKRFNQAWLLDPENGDVYSGFAIITAKRNGSPTEIEKYFSMATSKPKVTEDAYVDYGRFLWSQNRLDESLIKLQKALEISSKAYNARANISFVFFKKSDFIKACEWANDAKNNGDQLEPGYLEDICKRAAMR